MTAEYKVLGDIAVITMTNPPVNGLGFSTRIGITDGLSKANADDAVKAIVITGAGKAFSGGAYTTPFTVRSIPCCVTITIVPTIGGLIARSP